MIVWPVMLSWMVRQDGSEWVFIVAGGLLAAALTVSLLAKLLVQLARRIGRGIAPRSRGHVSKSPKARARPTVAGPDERDSLIG